MDTTTGEESARPLGVIGSLTAGFEMIGRHLWLIGLPVLLDLLLWLGPRLSVAPLLEQFVALLLAQPTADPTMGPQVAQAAQMLEQIGDQFNLFSLLGALPLLNVPSLLAQHVPGMVSPLGKPYMLLTTSVLTAMAWATALVPMGLLLGFLYLNSLARRVRALRSPDRGGSAPAQAEGASPSKAEEMGQTVGMSTSAGKFVRVLLFSVGLLVAGMLLIPLWMLLVGVALAAIPLLGFLVWSLGIGLGSYITLHLLFVVPGVLLGGRGLLRATWESILLIHMQFPSVVGLVLLVVVIYQGLGFVWSLPPGDSWALLIGVLGNGCIATGLTAALFVFYQERVGKLPGGPRLSAKTGVEK
jgi:hypothetical protein